MSRWRKKPVVIEAVRFEGFPPGGAYARRGAVVVPLGTGAGICECGARLEAHGAVQTLEGRMKACPGDWIITGVKGEHYPCKPDIFAATYEPAFDGPACCGDEMICDFISVTFPRETYYHCRKCGSVAASAGAKDAMEAQRKEVRP